MPRVKPFRGEIWLADLTPDTQDHEQRGTRPVLIISDDTFNHGPAELSVALPLTSTVRDIPSHIPICPPEGGVRLDSVIMCDNIRAISHSRLIRRLDYVSSETLSSVEDTLRILLGL